MRRGGRWGVGPRTNDRRGGVQNSSPPKKLVGFFVQYFEGALGATLILILKSFPHLSS